MLWHRRPYDCGSWLPEDKIAIICGMKGKNFVTYGCLPFSDRKTDKVLK